MADSEEKLSSLDVELLGRRREQDALADSLARLSEGFRNSITYPDVPVRSTTQSEEYAKEVPLAQAAPLDRKSTEISAAMRKVHEASRTQRDFEIIQAGRMKLLKGCLNAAAWRYAKLGRQIKAKETGEQI